MNDLEMYRDNPPFKYPTGSDPGPWTVCPNCEVDVPLDSMGIAYRHTCSHHTSCEWCNGSDDDDPNTDTLCRSHLAEYEGLSLDGLDRMEAEEAWDLL